MTIIFWLYVCLSVSYIHLKMLLCVCGGYISVLLFLFFQTFLWWKIKLVPYSTGMFWSHVPGLKGKKYLSKFLMFQGHFDMDYDGGSPLPEGSPLLGSTSSQSSGDNRVIARQMKRPPGRRKRVLRKRGKKLGRPFKIQSQGPGGIDDTSTIPTSILLMAGTSSRGRKIVRKEDMNFVT